MYRRQLDSFLFQWWFANPLPMVIVTEWSISALKTLYNSHKNQQCGSLRGVMVHVMFSRCFPGVPPVNLNLRTVYNHMDAVIICCDWDPDPPNILESDKFTFFALNYIIRTGGRTDRMTGRFSMYSCGIFFTHISCQRQVQLLCYFCLVM